MNPDAKAIESKLSIGPGVRKLNQHLFGDSRIGTRPKHEELQDVNTGEANHKTRAPKVDARCHPKFAISITIRVSDNRRRDNDGAATTLLDCLTRALNEL